MVSAGLFGITSISSFRRRGCGIRGIFFPLLQDFHHVFFFLSANGVVGFFVDVGQQLVGIFVVGVDVDGLFRVLNGVVHFGEGRIAVQSRDALGVAVVA